MAEHARAARHLLLEAKQWQISIANEELAVLQARLEEQVLAAELKSFSRAVKYYTGTLANKVSESSALFAHRYLC